MPFAQVETWKRAASDLGFKFVAPFTLEADGRRIEYFGLLPEFGSLRGMLVIVGPYTSAHLVTAKNQGFGFSCLSEDASPYDRESFVEMLSDWGWVGPKEQVPSWIE